MKNILITGFTGFLGSHIVNELVDHSDSVLFGFSRTKVKNSELSGLKETYSLEDWKEKRIPFHKIDILIHCAFARESLGEQLAESLSFTSEFFEDAVNGGASAIINISSQSVYGPLGGIHKEEDTPKPGYLYALAKYASELIVARIAKTVPYTNIRLAGLAMGNPIKTKGVLPLFVENTIENKTIRIKNGGNILSFIDVGDAATAIAKLTETDPCLWHEVYNLGNEWQISVLDLAKKVKEIGDQYLKSTPEIELDDLTQNINIGLNIDRIKLKTGWTPSYTLEEMVKILYEKMINSHNK